MSASFRDMSNLRPGKLKTSPVRSTCFKDPHTSVRAIQDVYVREKYDTFELLSKKHIFGVEISTVLLIEISTIPKIPHQNLEHIFQLVIMKHGE